MRGHRFLIENRQMMRLMPLVPMILENSPLEAGRIWRLANYHPPWGEDLSEFFEGFQRRTDMLNHVMHVNNSNRIRLEDVLDITVVTCISLKSELLDMGYIFLTYFGSDQLPRRPAMSEYLKPRAVSAAEIDENIIVRRSMALNVRNQFAG